MLVVDDETWQEEATETQHSLLLINFDYHTWYLHWTGFDCIVDALLVFRKQIVYLAIVQAQHDMYCIVIFHAQNQLTPPSHQITF